MKNKTNLFQVAGHLIFFVFLCSCSSGVSTVTEYKTWFNDPENGFVKEKNIDNLKIKVQYRPVELMILNELNTIPNPTLQDIDSLKQGYGNSIYFMMEIAYDERNGDRDGDIVKKGISDYNKYAERVKSLSFGLQEYVWLITEKDTLYSSIYHYERGYELGKRESFLFAFPGVADATGDVTFVFQDDFFDTGINKFQFKLKDKNIPTLPLKK